MKYQSEKDHISHRKGSSENHLLKHKLSGDMFVPMKYSLVFVGSGSGILKFHGNVRVRFIRGLLRDNDG